jgi:NADPH:quinone reductase-like Zn-dependent oxidoreductase
MRLAFMLASLQFVAQAQGEQRFMEHSTLYAPLRSRLSKCNPFSGCLQSRARKQAVGRGSENAALSKKLGASLYIDSKTTKPAEELQKLGGAQVILATAPNSKAMSELIDGLGPNGKLLVIGVAFEPIEVTPVQPHDRDRWALYFLQGSRPEERANHSAAPRTALFVANV